MALLGHSIGQCLLMACLNHLGSQNQNKCQTGTEWKLKLLENENMISKKLPKLNF